MNEKNSFSPPTGADSAPSGAAAADGSSASKWPGDVYLMSDGEAAAQPQGSEAAASSPAQGEGGDFWQEEMANASFWQADLPEIHPWQEREEKDSGQTRPQDGAVSGGVREGKRQKQEEGMRSNIHGETASAVPPKWGNSGTHADAGSRSALNGPDLSLGPASAGGGSAMPPEGAWLWLPRGIEPRKSWIKRHPILFWGGLILLFALVFNAGRLSMQKGAVLGTRLAVINVEGLILDGGSTIDWIEQVRTDPSFKGALIRINSPGGAVGPSQEIFAAVKRLAKEKPVVASLGSVAASGGYYIALGAPMILASPSTLTASIGVKMQVPNMEHLMQTIGISEKTLTTGALKDAGSTWRAMSPEEEEYFRALLADMYEVFIESISEARKMPIDSVRALADGRAMTGRQALHVRLVDQLGDQHDAVNALRGACKLSDTDPVVLVEGPEKPGGFLKELLFSLIRMAFEQKAVAETPVFMY